MLRPEALLRECIPCVPDGLEAHFAHIPADFIRQGEAQAGRAYFWLFTPPDAAADDTEEVVVSHGNLISYLVCRVLDAPAASWVNTDIAQGGMSRIVVGSSGRRKLLSHNETGHLSSE